MCVSVGQITLDPPPSESSTDSTQIAATHLLPAITIYANTVHTHTHVLLSSHTDTGIIKQQFPDSSVLLRTCLAWIEKLRLRIRKSQEVKGQERRDTPVLPSLSSRRDVPTAAIGRFQTTKLPLKEVD